MAICPKYLFFTQLNITNSRQNKFSFKVLGLIASTCFALSCTAIDPNQIPTSTQTTIKNAKQHHFVEKRVPTSTFLITTYQKLATPVQTIHVYIEGDGNSWRTKYKLSTNPTPKQALALKLAMRDPHPNVIYIARPCQYTPHKLDPLCTKKYWSSHRYAPEVIQATNEVLDQIKTKNTNFVLIGFSGGASVAALTASTRQDIQGLITVAGDLDHESLNQYHHTTPLHGSLNPKHIAQQLKNLPQQHFNGDKDTIVPTWVAEQFVKQVQSNCAQVHTFKGISHHQGWEELWPTTIIKPLRCPS